MDGFDNNYGDSDDEREFSEDGKSNLLSCKACGAEFDGGAKGVSRLKELCSKCHSSAIESLLDDEIESLTTPAPPDVSGVVDERAGVVGKAILPKVYTTSHTIIIYH